MQQHFSLLDIFSLRVYITGLCIIRWLILLISGLTSISRIAYIAENSQCSFSSKSCNSQVWYGAISSHCGGVGLIAKPGLTLVTPWTIICQAPLSMGFSRQDYWDGLAFPSPSSQCRLCLKFGIQTNALRGWHHYKPNSLPSSRYGINTEWLWILLSCVSPSTLLNPGFRSWC